jgi:hypothetical protein
MPAIAVIYAVRPKPGRREAVHELLKHHVPALRAADLITERPPILLWSSLDGAFVESFEWKSADHSRKAESTPAILDIWGKLAEFAEFVPLASLKETTNTFAHFEPL